MGLTEVDRVEVVAIDHRRDAHARLHDPRLPSDVVLIVGVQRVALVSDDQLRSEAVIVGEGELVSDPPSWRVWTIPARRS